MTTKQITFVVVTSEIIGLPEIEQRPAYWPTVDIHHLPNDPNAWRFHASLN
jgi:hypothetical protein